ncbi:MAG: SAM-dependent methyltransferase [Mycobacterium sp.]
MPESSIVVRPEPIGSDRYTESSRLQAAGLSTAISFFEESAQTVPLPPAPQPIVIADYGAATGHNSLLPIAAALKKLRARTRSEHAVLVAHTDVATNNFTALFQTLSEDPDSYLRHDPATFASAVGRSFYSQILPSDSVTLGWSSYACHWLSSAPGPVPGHVQVAYCQDEAVKAAYARQAALDWHEFVAFRGRELCPGGRLVVLTMAIDEDGGFGYRLLLDAIVEALRTLREGGFISESEQARMSIPVVGRSAKDFLAPFAPRGRFEDLAVDRVEVFRGEDRAWSRYQVDHDEAAFGAQWASFSRLSVFPALAAGLDGDPARHVEFLDRLERDVATRIAAAPEPMLIPLAAVVLNKRGRG